MPKTLTKPSTSLPGSPPAAGAPSKSAPSSKFRASPKFNFPACRFRSLPFVIQVESRIGRPGTPGSRHQQTNPLGDRTMRFMMIVKANKDSEAGKMPSEELLAAMAEYNEQLVNAG